MKTVLVVEDNPDDIYLMQRVWQRACIAHRLQFAADGKLAIDYLSARNDFSDRAKAPFPDIVFLDLNLPKRNGLEVLKWLREQPALQKLPVIVLSGALTPGDIDQAYKLGVTSCLFKKANVEEFTQDVHSILSYWFQFNLPSN